ncbi:MAG: hypothetical protein ABIP51_21315 [Bacteroidia bacterium]
MGKYNIFKNRAELSKEQVQEGMDFQKLQSSLPKTNKGFSKPLLIGITGIAIIASLLLYFKTKPTNETFDKIVLANAENPLKSFKLNTEKDTVLIYESGSIIKIEKGSFVDENGNEIKGEIDLQYREFHSVSETLLAGISMNYDSAGTTQYFESAGMFEILATQNNKAIRINKNKSIEVQLASLNSDPTKFNQYYLSDKNDQWLYLNKDSVNKITVARAIADSIKESPQYITQKIVKPEKANPKKQQFLIEVPKGIFPELEIFKNVLFEASSKNKNFDVSKATKSWNDVDIQRISQSKDYMITFINPNEKYEVIAYPVFDTTNYKNAIAKYNSLNEAFANKLNETVEQTKIKDNKLNSQLAIYVEAMNKYRDLIRKNQKIYSDSMAIILQNQRFTQSSQEIVYRTFQVKQFGIWNSDCPRNIPQGVNLAASYINDKGEVVKPAAVYLVEKDKNAMYSSASNQNISFNPDNENVLIIISTDNVLHWVSADGFSGITASDKKHTFNVRSLKKISYSLADINNIII